jgi:hypothetical protein
VHPFISKENCRTEAQWFTDPGITGQCKTLKGSVGRSYEYNEFRKHKGLLIDLIPDLAGDAEEIDRHRDAVGNCPAVGLEPKKDRRESRWVLCIRIMEIA